MSTDFEIVVDAKMADRWFGEALERYADLTPLLRDIGELLIESTQDRFRTGTAPDGRAWKPVKRGGHPLLKTGRMRDDIHSRVGADFVEIRATARQAIFHQEGTGPYVIVPSRRKALAWKGGPGPRGKVHHPGLVARPFMGLSALDIAAIDRVAANWLKGP